jgi:hypothetical protein
VSINLAKDHAMRINPLPIVAVLCVLSTSSYAAARPAILDAYYMDPPPKSNYLGKMKAKWANYVKARQPHSEVDLMPEQTVKVKPVKPKYVPKTVTVPKMTPKATVRRFTAANRTLVKQPDTAPKALPFWQDLPSR